MNLQDLAFSSGSGARLIADASGSCAPWPRIMEALLCLLALLLLGCASALDGKELPATGRANVSVYQDLQPGAGAMPCYILRGPRPARNCPAKRSAELLLAQGGRACNPGRGRRSPLAHTPCPRRLGWLALHFHNASESAVKAQQVGQ